VPDRRRASEDRETLATRSCNDQQQRREAAVCTVVDMRNQVISERFLSEDDRVGIADLRSAGFGVRAIAAQLGRSPSTVSRELRRNRDPGSGQYRPSARSGWRPGGAPGPVAAS
jgi:hypothetical protein